MINRLLQIPRTFLKKGLERADFVRGGINRNDIFGALYRAWGYVFTNHLYGDYIEFGVYTGDSLCESFNAYKPHKKWLTHELKNKEIWRRELAQKYVTWEPNFHGFDTFDGMPPNDEDKRFFVQGSYKSAIDNVIKRCKGIGLEKPILHLYKGLFHETKNIFQGNIQNRKAAIVHIDCDLYESAKEALRIISPYLQQGTILLFDDFNCFSSINSKGERRALKEFLQTRHHYFEPFFSYKFVGQSFICHLMI